MPLARQLLLAGLVLALVIAAVVMQRSLAVGPAAEERQGGGRPPVTVVLAEARAGLVTERVEAVGTTLAKQAIEVMPVTSGRVKEIVFAPGQEVERGAVMVRLDDELEQAALAEAEAVLREAERAFERANQLSASRSIAAAAVDEAEARRASAAAKVDAARRRLADRTVRAPFAGRAGLRGVDVGAMVDDKTVLTTLDDLSEVQLDFTVSEIHYGKVAPGQRVLATATAFADEAFEGGVVTVDSRVDRATRAFRLRASIPNPDRRLPAGMFMRVELVLGERPAVLVPEEAVLLEAGQPILFVVEDGKARQRQVRIGRREADRVEILEGVQAGEQVVVEGVQKLRDGAPVKPREPAPAVASNASAQTPAAGTGQPAPAVVR